MLTNTERPVKARTRSTVTPVHELLGFWPVEGAFDLVNGGGKVEVGLLQRQQVVDCLLDVLLSQRFGAQVFGEGQQHQEDAR